jgi:hypothetical protein
MRNVADKQANPLDELSPEQLETVLNALRDTLISAQRPLSRLIDAKQPSVAAEHVYYRVTDGYFETIIDSRDLIQPHNQYAAWSYSRVNKLQSWYYVGRADTADSQRLQACETITRNQYIDWLRQK